MKTRPPTRKLTETELQAVYQAFPELNDAPIEHTLDECRDMGCGCRERAPQPDTGKPAHSPLPWKVAHSISNDAEPYVHQTSRDTYECVIECDEYTVATTGENDRNAAIANARLIVRAVNNAEGLAEALRRVLEAIEAGTPEVEPDVFDSEILGAESTLAAYEKEQQQ